MTIRTAITTIACCTLLGSVIGTGLGYGLGTLAPEYYRSIFNRGREPAFDPVSVGIGLGLTDGTTVGILVGIAIVALICRSDLRRDQDSGRAPLQDSEQTAPRSVTRRLFLASSSVLILALVAGIGLILGLLLGESSAYHRRYREERAIVAPLLAGDQSFADVEIYERSDGGAILSGKVPTVADLERLKSSVSQAVGEAREKQMTRSVSVGD